MKLETYRPKTKQEFWCSKCDNHIVNSENPSSGHFYTQSGHAYNQASKEFDGHYTTIMFAICANCEKE